jgi:hypothetical protein
MALGAALAITVMTAGTAFAHECYNTSRSDQGNTSIAAHSPNYVTFNQDAFLFLTGPNGPGLCADGANYLIGLIDQESTSLGISGDTMVFMNATQAGGVGHRKDVPAIQVLSNGKGVDHLEENQTLNDFLFANLGDAAALCGP